MIGAISLAPPLQAVTGSLAVLVALVTQLGDVWFLFTVVALSYWLDEVAPWVGRGLDRERAVLVVALLVGAVAVLDVLKPLFAVPRPRGFAVAPPAELVPVALEPVYVWMATASGYGFPSGHALASTVVWGGLAWGVRVGRRRTRAAVAAGLVAGISASRILLGVHSPVDVVAGVVIGLAYLVLVVRWLRDPGPAFVLATGIALVSLIDGLTADAVAVAGLSVGVTATWYRFDEALTSESATRTGALATAGIGSLTAGPLLIGAVVLEVPALARLVAGAVGGSLLLALPLIGEHVGRVVGDRVERPASES